MENMQENTAVVHPSFIKKWASLVVMSLALAIIVIDTTLLNVSLGYIIRDLKTDIQSLQWVITAYSLILAAFTITGGRLGDIFGKKKMFMLGAIIFALGSLLASFSQNFGQLLLGESIIEGIGAALMMPATSSLLIASFQGRDRAIAFGVWGGIAAAASAIGPILGGYLTNAFSWRWGFRINVVVVVILLLGSILIQDKIPPKRKALDWLGVFLSSTGLLGIVFAIIESSTYGWWTAKEPLQLFGQTLNLGGLSIVPFSLVLGIILLGSFIFYEIRREASGKMPLVSMKIFLNKTFSSGLVTMSIMALGQSGIVFSIPVFLQSVRGLDSFNTGLALLPLSLSLLVAAPTSAFLSKWIMPKRLIQAGLLLNTIGVLILYFTINIDSNAWSFVPGLLIYGTGMGLVMSQISNITLSALPASSAGEASGVNNTVRQIGGALGSAIIGAALISSLSANITQDIAQHQHIPTVLKPYLTEVATSQTSNIEFNGGARIAIKLPESILEDVKNVGIQATTDANKTSLAYTAFFAFCGFLFAFFLPKVKHVEPPKGQPVAGH